MAMFVIACGVTIAAGLLAAARHSEGVLALPLGLWLPLLALLVFGLFGSSICLRSRRWQAASQRASVR
jgi:Flp pilus assembly protein TadG